MTERWKPQKLEIRSIANTGLWSAFNEAGKYSIASSQPEALAWVFKNWAWCWCCDSSTPQLNGVCRCCGRRSGDEWSAFSEIRHTVADALMMIRFDPETEDWTAQRDNYLMDAEDVIALLPHLLPLDVREAMFGEEA